MIKTLIKNRPYFTTVKQWIDQPQELAKKVKQLAQMIRSAKYPIFFTGAGCSTSLNIPDYRSGSDTIVPTGPGVWNQTNRKYEDRAEHQQKIQKILNTLQPSITHMAIKTLLDKQIFKYLVSQNTDGYHLRSGVPHSKIAQLHGNNNLEHCVKCGKKYLRDYRVLPPGVRSDEEKKKHITGRACENCGGQLLDSIVYFGEKIPKDQLARSYQQAAKSDLCLCIGSSLTVKPAINVPIIAVQYNSQLCIINIQETPLDGNARIKINDFCDRTMEKLMEELNVPIKEYHEQRYIQISFDEKSRSLAITGKQKNWNNFSFIKSIKFPQLHKQAQGSQVILNQLELSDILTIEIQIMMHREKPSVYLTPAELYKLQYGEPVRLQITRKSGQNWEVIHL